MNEQDSNDRSPLWKYVTKMDKMAGGGNVSFECNYCRMTFKGSYSRVRAHLLKLSGYGIRGCAEVTSQHLVEMKKVVEEAELRVKKPFSTPVPVPTSSSRNCSSSASGATSKFEAFWPKKRKGTVDLAIENALNLEAHEELHSEIARMFYSSGLPFHLAKNPYFISSFTKAANSNMLSGYIPPSYNLLRTTLLQKERARIEEFLKPIKNSWKEKGVSIVSNGWTDPQRRPIINFMAVCESGPMFLKAVICEGEYKDKHFIANLIKEIILEVGPQNVVQVITDNGPVCKGAGLLIEAQFPHICWTPCLVHTLNLVLRNICAARNIEGNTKTYEECNWITNIIGDVMVIKNFFMNHSMKLSMFGKHMNLKMLSIAETRFASNIVMLKRFKKIKHDLQNMVISDGWMSYREDDLGKAAFVKEKVLDDLWWDNIDYILSFTRPIYEMLKMTDTDMPCLHLIYDMWGSMIKKVKTAIYSHEGKHEHEESMFYSVVHQILMDRWGNCCTPLYFLAHSLNPRCYSAEWLQGSPERVPPHKDNAISTERQRCFEKYFPDFEDRRQVNTEYAKFSAACREFATSDSVSDRGLMEPDLWWVIHGSSTPLLQTLAMKLLGQPCSSSCCERNWSNYSFVDSFKKNLTTPKIDEDLVYVHCNLRLLSRKSPHYIQGETKMWDVGGDAFATLEVAGVLEIADLSLDEPDLEVVLFIDDNNADEDQLIEVN